MSLTTFGKKKKPTFFMTITPQCFLSVKNTGEENHNISIFYAHTVLYSRKKNNIKYCPQIKAPNGE
ncbi:hypothetical protein KKF84_08475 [Myxococcota bacterium]|nr:hypothetical protein [Myxococcota bacterium]